MRHRLVNLNGREIKPGEVLISHGETWTLESFYVKEPPSTGRVVVIRGEETREFYPSVFSLRIEEINDPHL